MGQIRHPEPVKLVCGVLAADAGLLTGVREALGTALGPIDLTSEVWPFTATDYYAAQTGPAIVRQFLSVAEAIDPGELARVKRRTNELETELAAAGPGSGWPRPVNLDPGYVAADKLVLATTKNYAHRVYLRDGIYAEVTLRWLKGRWAPWPWTYPDYADPRYHAFFTEVRERLMAARRKQNGCRSNVP